jgi:uncharacterized surface protein with fasciclin (FAS1) repeats
LTVFAASDDALRNATNLSTIEHDPVLLNRVVAFHIVADVVDVGQLTARHASTTVVTLEGHTVTVTTDDNHAEIENVAIERQRIIAGNGSLYAIDGLLEPPS